MRVAARGENPRGHHAGRPFHFTHSIPRIRFRAPMCPFFEVQTYLIRRTDGSSEPAREFHRQGGLIETPERQAGTSTLLAK